MKRALVAALVLVLVVLNLVQWRRSRRSDEEVVRSFQQLFVARKSILSNKWLGIQAIQHPFDAWVTQEIITEVKPDVIVETGTLWGGSAVLWATILEQVNPEGRVITIDIAERPKLDLARKLPVGQRHVEFLRGSSTAPEIVAEVQKRVKGKKTLVIFDSLHTKEHVLNELKAYSPMVTVGSYVIVQDTHLGDIVPHWYMAPKDWWTPGPLQAVDAFMAGNNEFQIDASREHMLATFNHKGFLKRVR